MILNHGGVRRPHPWVRVVVVGLAGLAVSLSGLLTLDAERSFALDSPDQPTTSVVDHSISYATYPEREARTHTVDAALVDQLSLSASIDGR